LGARERAEIAAELVARERLTMKAIARRHCVSVSTLWQLRDEMRRQVNGFRSDNSTAKEHSGAHGHIGAPK
jgi:hypothetical protein